MGGRLRRGDGRSDLPGRRVGVAHQLRVAHPDAERILAEAADAVREKHPSLGVETIAVQGPAAKVLVDASKDAALLAVGSRGHGQFAGMIIGSVSEHCVAHAHCPVLVYRHEGQPTR